MTFEQAKRTIKTAVKLATPYGLVRAIQVSREHKQLMPMLQQASANAALLHKRVETLESEHQRRCEMQQRQQEAERSKAREQSAGEAVRLAAESEAFRRNEVVLDGKRIYSRNEAPLIDLRIDGCDNSVVIHQPTGPGTLHVIVNPGTVGCRFEFGARNRIVSNVFVSFFDTGGNHARQSVVVVGDDNLFNGNVHIMAGICPSTQVRIGDENLFADNIHIMGAVEHLTYDVGTMEPLSVEKGVSIGDRVWICRDALIYNKSDIASDNVVAARAFTNSEFREGNTVIAGAPAKVTKKGVMWHLHTTDAFLTSAGPLDVPA